MHLRCRFSLVLSLAFALCHALAAGNNSAVAAIVASYTFAGSLDDSVDTDSQSTATPFTASAGISANVGFSTTVGNPQPSRQVGASVTANPDLAAGFAAGDYFSFTVTPTAGDLDLQNLTLDFGASYNTQPRGFSLFSTVDGFDVVGDAISTTTVPVNSDSTTTLLPYTIDLSASKFQNLVGTIEFRLYVFDNATGASSFIRFDNVTLNTIPEPATWSMLLFGIASLSFIRLRR